MPYPYLGNAPRMYTQYRDTATDAPLQPEPGGSYDMAPIDGAGPVPVPPGDGLWGLEAEPDAAPAPPASAKTAKSSKAAPAADGEA